MSCYVRRITGLNRDYLRAPGIVNLHASLLHCDHPIAVRLGLSDATGIFRYGPYCGSTLRTPVVRGGSSCVCTSTSTTLCLLACLRWSFLCFCSPGRSEVCFVFWHLLWLANEKLCVLSYTRVYIRMVLHRQVSSLASCMRCKLAFGHATGHSPTCRSYTHQLIWLPCMHHTCVCCSSCTAFCRPQAPRLHRFLVLSSFHTFCRCNAA